MADFINLRGQNLWDIPANVRVIPVNTMGVMGAGLAKQAADRVPGLLDAYRNVCKSGFKVGEIYTYVCPQTEEIYIFFPSKEDWRDRTQLEHIVGGLKALAETLVAINASIGLTGVRKYPTLTLGIPPVGSGLGNVSRRNRPTETPPIQANVVRVLIKTHLALVPNLTVFVF